MKLRWKRFKPGVYDSTNGRWQLTYVPAYWELRDTLTPPDVAETLWSFPTKTEAQEAAQAEQGVLDRAAS